MTFSEFFLNNKKSILKAVVAIFLGMLLTISIGFMQSVEIAISSEWIINKIRAIISSTAFTSYVPGILYACYIWKKGELPKREDAPIVVLAFIFALLTMVAVSLSVGQSLTVYLSNKLTALFAFISACTFAAVLFSLIKCLFRYLLGYLHRIRLKDNKIYNQKKVFLFSCAILAIAWLPYVVIFAPGSDCPDITGQLEQFLGLRSYSTHHPLVSTFIYGSIFSIGSAMGDVGGGVLVISLFQTAVLVLASSYVVVAANRVGAPFPVLVGILLFFVLNPVFGSYCQWAVKDTLFAVCFSIYTTSFILFAWSHGEKKDRGLVVMLIISAFLTGLTRNNGFYVVALSLPFLCFCVIKGRRLQWLLCFVLVIFGIFGTNLAAKVVVNAEQGSVAEALSIPFQQTARYVSDYPDDIEDWEREAIDQALGFDTLAERYKWDISDPVKGGFKKDSSLSLYFRAWISQGLKHPLCYLTATLDQTYGYWSVLPSVDYGREYAGYYLGSIQKSGKISGSGSLEKWLPTVSKVIAGCMNFIIELPILKLFSQAGWYFWILLAAAAFAIYSRNPKTLIFLLPCFVLFLTCVAGPLNGSIRYMFGIIASCPIVVTAVVFAPLSQHREKRNDEARCMRLAKD